jgi:hypothetical protein
MLGVMARAPGHENEVDLEASIDRKPHEMAIVCTGRRVRCTGL